MNIQPPGTDPRAAAGTIEGDGGPWDRNGVVIDATNAVLMDGMTVALIEPVKDGQKVGAKPYWCLNLEGRINKTQDRSRVNYLFDADGAAAIIAELMALGSRQGPVVHGELMTALNTRLTLMKQGGNL
jgi:hypothetical protein